jgi:ATP-dependent protease ClpP protease subunit
MADIVIKDTIRDLKDQRAELITLGVKNATVDILIDSYGGDTAEMINFISAMNTVQKKNNVKIRCYVPSVAASAAFQILLECNERYILRFTYLMFHEPAIIVNAGWRAKPHELAKYAAELEALRQVIEKQLCSKLNMARAEILKHYQAETAWTGVALSTASPGTFTILDEMYDKELLLLNYKAPVEDSLFPFAP